MQETADHGILQPMSRTLLPEAVERYVTQEIAHETDVQRRLRAETAGMPHAGMQIGADQGALLALLAKFVGARRAIEIGTFTGYSALAVASALPADGKLICCDVSDEWTSVARRYWQEAGVAGRIELRLAPAIETLATLLQQGGAETFDLAFIDADKEGYVEYYEAILPKLAPGGLIAADNTLFGSGGPNDAITQAISDFNEHVLHDERVEAVLLPLRDGVTLIRRR